jgi:ankyrin repeat protein
MYSVRKDDTNFVNFLLEKRANPNIKGKDGNTATHLAFERQHFDIVMMLILAKADLNILNDLNQTPLSFGTENFLKSLNLSSGICYSSNGLAVI